MTHPSSPDLQRLVDDILASRKYRSLGIPPETVLNLLELELPRYKNTREAVRSVRRILHNVVAPYLGDPEFSAAAARLDEAFRTGSDAAVRSECRAILSSHASTLERLPLLDDFYPRLFQVTGQPASILDLACGLNPFAWRWMGLPASIRYHACDLNQPRIALIQHYFQLEGLPPLAVHRDFLLEPPDEFTDVVFLFKEAHRLEQRQSGCNRPLWQAVQTHWLLVSLPTGSLSGKHNLVEKHRRLVAAALEGLNWPVTEVIFPTEIVFCIEKPV